MIQLIPLAIKNWKSILGIGILFLFLSMGGLIKYYKGQLDICKGKLELKISTIVQLQDVITSKEITIKDLKISITNQNEAISVANNKVIEKQKDIDLLRGKSSREMKKLEKEINLLKYKLSTSSLIVNVPCGDIKVLDGSKEAMDTWKDIFLNWD